MKIQLETGQTIEMDDNATEADIHDVVDHLAATAKTPDKPKINVLEDVGKSALQGIREGITFPYDLASMATTAVMNKKLGIDKEFQTPAPSVSDVLEPIGLNHTPETTAGEYARTAGNFLPFGMGGEGALAARIGRRVLAPAIASEASGQATKGTEAEPYARFLGALVGGGVGLKPSTDAIGKTIGGMAKSVGNDAGAFKAGLSARVPSVLDEAVDVMQKNSSKSYQAMKDANVYLKPNGVQALSQKMMDALKEPGKINDRLHGDTLSVMRDFAKQAKSSSISLEEVDQYKRLLNGVIKKNIVNNPEDAMRAQVIKSSIDDFVSSLQNNPTLTTASGPQAASALKNGIAEYAKSKKFEQIADIITKSDGSPVKLKKLLNDLANNPRKSAGFTADEMGAIQNAAKYSGIENTLKLLGKFGIDIGGHGQGSVVVPTLVSMGIGGASHGVEGAGIGAAATLAGGTLARQAQKTIAAGKAEKILKLIEQRNAAKAPPPPTSTPIQPRLSP